MGEEELADRPVQPPLTPLRAQVLVVVGIVELGLPHRLVQLIRVQTLLCRLQEDGVLDEVERERIIGYRDLAHVGIAIERHALQTAPETSAAGGRGARYRLIVKRGPPPEFHDDPDILRRQRPHLRPLQALRTPHLSLDRRDPTRASKPALTRSATPQAVHFSTADAAR